MGGSTAGLGMGGGSGTAGLGMGAPPSNKPKPTAASLNVGSWEKHTRGFGLRMLMKQGFTGGGLGKEGKGISRHVEVAVRPQGAGLGGPGNDTSIAIGVTSDVEVRITFDDVGGEEGVPTRRIGEKIQGHPYSFPASA